MIMVYICAVLLAVDLVLLVIDWRQTLFIASSPDDDWHESNPILGYNPKPRTVHVYFAACCAVLVALGLLAYQTDHLDALCVVLVGLAAIEVICVTHNYRVGIRV